MHCFLMGLKALYISQVIWRDSTGLDEPTDTDRVTVI